MSKKRNAAHSPSPAAENAKTITNVQLGFRPSTKEQPTGSSRAGWGAADDVSEHMMIMIAFLHKMDEELYCTLRLSAGTLALACAKAITEVATRSAFSGAANERGALQDRMHEWIGYCDQAGQSTSLGSCPIFWQPITDMLPDKLVLGAMIMTMLLYVEGAWRQRNPRVLTRLLSETCWLWSLLLCLRAAVVAATIMPAPSPLCRNATQWAQGPGGRPTQGWFLTSIDCNDAMFSGHTCVYQLRQNRSTVVHTLGDMRSELAVDSVELTSGATFGELFESVYEYHSSLGQVRLIVCGLVAIIHAMVGKGYMERVHAVVLRWVVRHTGSLHLRRAGGIVCLRAHMYAPCGSYPWAFCGCILTTQESSRVPMRDNKQQV